MNEKNISYHKIDQNTKSDTISCFHLNKKNEENKLHKTTPKIISQPRKNRILTQKMFLENTSQNKSYQRNLEMMQNIKCNQQPCLNPQYACN